jgi:hypothetical protein
MTNYETQARLEGDPSRALEFAAAALTAAGFSIDTRTDSMLGLTGPTMLNSRQDPIVGAGHLELQAAGGTLRAMASLSGVQFMMRLLGGILILVAMILVVTSQLIPRPPDHGRWYMALIMLAPLSPWPILFPVLLVFFKRRTIRAMNTLVNNAVKMSQASP